MTEHVAGSNHFIFSGPHTHTHTNAQIYADPHKYELPSQDVHEHKCNTCIRTEITTSKCASIYNACAQKYACTHPHAHIQVNTLMHTFSLYTFSAFQMRQTTGEI